MPNVRKDAGKLGIIDLCEHIIAEFAPVADEVERDHVGLWFHLRLLEKYLNSKK